MDKIKFKIIAGIIVFSCMSFPGGTVLGAVFPGSTWQTKTPAELGMDESKLNQFVSNVGGNGVIVKDGYIVKTWGDPTQKGDWASAAKPVISTMLFFAIHEGKLAGVNALIKDQGWPLIEKDQGMTFHHLANMIGNYARGEKPGEATAYNDYGIQQSLIYTASARGQ